MLLDFLAVAALCNLCSALNPPNASQNGTILSPDIGSFISSVLNDWNSSAGIAVAVVRLDDQGTWTVETKGYGVAKADGSNVTENTLFSIGSDSKVRQRVELLGS